MVEKLDTISIVNSLENFCCKEERHEVGAGRGEEMGVLTGDSFLDKHVLSTIGMTRRKGNIDGAGEEKEINGETARSR